MRKVETHDDRASFWEKKVLSCIFSSSWAASDLTRIDSSEENVDKTKLQYIKKHIEKKIPFIVKKK